MPNIYPINKDTLSNYLVWEREETDEAEFKSGKWWGQFAVDHYIKDLSELRSLVRLSRISHTVFMERLKESAVAVEVDPELSMVEFVQHMFGPLAGGIFGPYGQGYISAFLDHHEQRYLSA